MVDAQQPQTHSHFPYICTLKPIFISEQSSVTVYSHPCFLRGLGSKNTPHPPPKAKCKSLQINEHPQYNVVFFTFSIFFCLFIIINVGLLLLSVQLLEHHVVWLEDLFKLSNNSDAPKY